MNPMSAVQAKPEEKRTEKPPRRKRAPRQQSTTPGNQNGSREAKRTAAAVLEVLAGARTPTEAAEVLKVSSARYYVLESRALQGLVHACEKRPAGPRVAPEKALAKLTREADKLRSEAARYQALARATQRTVGIAPPKAKKKKRSRKPKVRALMAAKRLKAEAGTETAAPAATAAAPQAEPSAKPGGLASKSPSTPSLGTRGGLRGQG